MPRSTTPIVLFATALLAACNHDATSVQPLAPTVSQVAIRTGADVHLVAGSGIDTLSALLLTSDGTPVSGATVSWQVYSGDGTLSSSNTVSDANGLVSTMLQAGVHAGPMVITASVGTQATASVAVTVDAGAPARLIAMAPPVDSVVVGASWNAAAVEVVDIYGNPVSGVTILATELNAGDGDGLAAPFLLTGADGVATENFIAGMNPGERQPSFQTADGSLQLVYTIDVLDTDSTMTNGTTASVRKR